MVEIVALLSTAPTPHSLSSGLHVEHGASPVAEEEVAEDVFVELVVGDAVDVEELVGVEVVCELEVGGLRLFGLGGWVAVEELVGNKVGEEVDDVRELLVGVDEVGVRVLNVGVGGISDVGLLSESEEVSSIESEDGQGSSPQSSSPRQFPGIPRTLLNESVQRRMDHILVTENFWEE
ncbi:hypothetical protein NUU61_002300 [Penicillium alfredii]|uniref:Uncharacterized protein n=1 Tax=Penicillium alfredii TaxID=1506179 RepID=A0A9W9KGR5_9EURO|nr:uncharacterized protein NUU61_002300 [Penicillium alfredii]KAJ5104953.1 hypothetical protein NUU61_002300 [Penicillium alfredii]